MMQLNLTEKYFIWLRGLGVGDEVILQIKHLIAFEEKVSPVGGTILPKYDRFSMLVVEPIESDPAILRHWIRCVRSDGAFDYASRLTGRSIRLGWNATLEKRKYIPYAGSDVGIYPTWWNFPDADKENNLLIVRKTPSDFRGHTSTVN